MWRVIKMGNIVLMVRIHTSYDSAASVLTITLPRLPDVITKFVPPCTCDSLPGEVNVDYYVYYRLIVSLLNDLHT